MILQLNIECNFNCMKSFNNKANHLLYYFYLTFVYDLICISYKGLFIHDVITFGWYPDPLPLAIMSSFSYPPPLYAQMVRRIDLQQNSVRRVADDYLFSSAALSMFRFDMHQDLRLGMFFEIRGLAKI